MSASRRLPLELIGRNRRIAQLLEISAHRTHAENQEAKYQRNKHLLSGLGFAALSITANCYGTEVHHFATATLQQGSVTTTVMEISALTMGYIRSGTDLARAGVEHYTHKLSRTLNRSLAETALIATEYADLSTPDWVAEELKLGPDTANWQLQKEIDSFPADIPTTE